MCSRRWCRWRERRGGGNQGARAPAPPAGGRTQRGRGGVGGGRGGTKGGRTARRGGGAERKVAGRPKKGGKQVWLTDPESGFLRTARGWELGYTADLAVSDDHLIVAARVTQNATDNASLVPMVEEVERQCGARAEKVTADSGFFSGQALRMMKQQGIDLYVPDNNLKHEMQTGKRAQGIGQSRIRDPEHRRMRAKLRTQAG